MTRRLAAPVAAIAVLIAIASAPAMAAGGGKPIVKHEVIHETFFDEYLFEICGVESDTTQTQRTTTKTFADGSQTIHHVAEWVPHDPSLASERWGRTDRIAPDGTHTIVGLAVRVYRQGEGTIIRDAGWIRFFEDGLVVRGPHPFFVTDPADVYC
jgi:hypothetical protein